MEFKRWKNIGEILPEYVETFCNLYNEREEILKEIEEFSRKTKTPILLPSSAALLKLITELKRPEKVLKSELASDTAHLQSSFQAQTPKLPPQTQTRRDLKSQKSFSKGQELL